MKNELITQICAMMMAEGVEIPLLRERLELVFEPYDVKRAETALTVRNIAMNDQWFKKFIACKMVDGCTDKTIKYYSAALKSVFNKIQKIADETTVDDLRLYIAKRQRFDGVSKVTTDNELRVLKSFYGWMVQEGIMNTNPAARIKKIRFEKKKKEAFSDMDVERIRANCNGERQTAIVEMLLSTGCRVSELVGIKLDEMNGDRCVVHGKGQKDRTVYLSAKAQIAVERYMAKRNDDNPYLFAGGIFDPTRSGKHKSEEWWTYTEFINGDDHLEASTVEAITRNIGKRAGVKDCHPHRFRRTCATNALKRGMGLAQVSKMLGHESIATTQIYLDINEEELEAQHRKFVT